MTNQSKLLLVVMVLALLRFAVVPFLEYQEQSKAELELLTQQLDKAEQLMNSKEQLQQVIVASEKQFSMLRDLFFKDENTAQFRLSQQQLMQQRLTEFNTEVNFFDWLGQKDLSDGQIEVHQARIILEGNFADLLRAYIEVIAAMPTVRVTEFELLRDQSRRVRKSSAQGPKGSLTLMLEYSRLVKVPS
jgi:UDP-glucose 6-dehydrogenase